MTDPITSPETALEAAFRAVGDLRGRDVPRRDAEDAGEGYDLAIDEAQAAIRALRSRIPQQGWRPIETAPKDGTDILVAGPRHGGGWYLTTTAWPVGWLHKWPSAYMNMADGGPTHWMPLPAAPSPEKRDEQ